MLLVCIMVRYLYRYGAECNYWLIAMFFLLPIGLYIDRTVLDIIRVEDFYWLSYAADWISFFGDFYTGIIPVCFYFLGRSFFYRRDALRRLVLCVLLASLTAGLFTISLRTVTGRPRPYAEIADGFHGPSWWHKYNSFPSAHATAAFGAATPLYVVHPSIGVPALGFAALVAWSRLQMNVHHPMDVIVGAYIGIFFGLMYGRSLRYLTVRFHHPE